MSDAGSSQEPFCCKKCLKGTAHKPDSARSWLVCAAGMLNNITVYGTLNSFGVLYPSLLHHFNKGKVQTAWVSSLAMSLTCFLAPVAGFLLGRLDPRLVTLAGLICCSVGLFLTSQVSSLWMMFLTYSILFAFGVSCVYTAVFCVVPRYFVKRRSLATALNCTGPGAGVLLMSQVFGLSVNALGWREALLVAGGLHALLCVASVAFDPNIARTEMTESNCGGAWVRYQGSMETRLWKNRLFLVVAIAVTLNHMGMTMPQVHMARYCEDLRINLSKASKLYLSLGISSMVSRIVAGRLSDLTWVNPRYLAQGGIFAVGLSTVLCPFAQDFASLMVYFTVLGAADGFFATACNILSIASVPESCYSKAVSTRMIVMSFGMLAGPPLGGFIAESFGSYVPAFYTAGSISIAGSLTLFFAACGQNQPEDLDSRKQVEFNNGILVVEKVTAL